MNTQTQDVFRKYGTGPRSTRRRWVLLTLTALILYVLLAMLGAGLWAVLALLLFAIGAFGMSLSIALMEGRGDESLDERQRAARDRAHRRAYPFASWYIVAMLVVLSLRPDLPESPLRAVFIGLGLLLVALPGAFIAWTEPDPPSD